MELSGQKSGRFLKLRRSLTAFKYYWKIERGLSLNVCNYDRIDKTLGNDCPGQPSDKAFFSTLSSHYSSLDRDLIFSALHNHLHSITRTDYFMIF